MCAFFLFFVAFLGGGVFVGNIHYSHYLWGETVFEIAAA